MDGMTDWDHVTSDIIEEVLTIHRASREDGISPPLFSPRLMALAGKLERLVDETQEPG